MITGTSAFTRMKEFDRVVASLRAGIYTRSNIFFLFYRRHRLPCFWTVENIDALLESGGKEHTVGTTITLWAENADVEASELLAFLRQQSEPEILGRAAKKGNLINLTDFILAVSLSDDGIRKHPEVATHMCYLAYREDTGHTEILHLLHMTEDIRNAFKPKYMPRSSGMLYC